jgi:hypothetical protein
MTDRRPTRSAPPATAAIVVRPTSRVDYKTIYEEIRAQLVAETERRPGRALEEWILAERKCVMREVNRQRKLLGYELVGIAAVERAERTACGHSDYVSKYAHAAADLVLREKTT